MEAPVRIYDVVVVGGGPAGLVTAIALAKAGADVALIAPPAPDDHRTSALLAGSMQLLHDIGVGEAVESVAFPLETMRIVDGTKRLIRAPEVAFIAREIDLPCFGYNVANRDLVRVLETELGVLPHDRIMAFADQFDVSDPDHALIRTSNGLTVHARLVVGADGRKSAVREAAGISVRCWSYPQTAVVCNIRHTVDHRDTSTEFHTESGPFTLVPFGVNQSSVVCVVPPQEAERLMALSDHALARIFEAKSAYLLGRIEINSPRQCWPMSSQMAAAATSARVALVSEAAHAFPPIGAQGLNLGLRDIAALADVVRASKTSHADIGSSKVLDQYDHRRRVDVASRTVAVDLLNRSLLTGFLPVQLARNIGLNLARSVPVARKLLMREGMGAGLRTVARS